MIICYCRQELELWDEVVQCYQLLDKPHRAEIVVREQLKESETPYMITALADLTHNEELYERAWLLSRGRYPRAKRTLAKNCYDRGLHSHSLFLPLDDVYVGEYEACILHLDAALAVHPLIATSWYLRGVAAMRIEVG